jgi:hypothetical protein
MATRSTIEKAHLIAVIRTSARLSFKRNQQHQTVRLRESAE